MRAVVFDDDAQVRDLIAKVLTQRQYTVLTYPTSHGFCATEQDSCPYKNDVRCADIVISDIQMNGESGLEFAARLRKKQCPIAHIALLSGNWTADLMATGRQLGCEIFHKPVPLNDLLHWIDRCKTPR